jgi:isopenicillin N synthase-like dioxygenase
MIVYTPPKPAEAIPLIDMGAAETDVVWDIHKACRDTGFFYVANHGIPDAAMAAQLDGAKHLFALPASTKHAIHFDKSSRRMGYEPMQRQTLDAGSAPDFKESFMYLAAPPANGGSAIDNPLNQWPADFADFEPQMAVYGYHVGVLGRQLMRLIALSLELPEDFFADAFARSSFAVRLLHYPPQSAAGANNQIGAGAHTDWGAITILLQDDAGGLEVRNAAGEWICADPIPGALVINLGDLIRRWSNDLYHSTLHRVLNKASGRDRYSVATFCSPDYAYRVECLPTCRPASGEPRYAPCTVGEHLAEMARQTYALTN